MEALREEINKIMKPFQEMCNQQEDCLYCVFDSLHAPCSCAYLVSYILNVGKDYEKPLIELLNKFNAICPDKQTGGLECLEHEICKEFNAPDYSCLEVFIAKTLLKEV